jgi:hypothetical protein
MNATKRRPPGAQPGPPGPPQVLREPPAPVALFPAAGACGPREPGEWTWDHPHQVLALPGMQPAVRPGRLYQGRCLACGTLCPAALPAEQASG